MDYNLARRFYENACSHPEKLALIADGKSFTYHQLLKKVISIVTWLMSADDRSPERIGILGSRSAEACAGILAAAWVGAGYVSLNLKQPQSALIEILQRTDLSAVIADHTGSRMLNDSVLSSAPPKVLAVADTLPSSATSRVTFWDNLSEVRSSTEPVARKQDDLAYILFTSGSTGKPKGVMVPTGAVDALLRAMEQQFPVSSDDHFAETTEISFDLSVYNMFATWRAGASLHIVPATQALAPAKFIRDHAITVWLSVPSIAVFMKKMGLLTPQAFPNMRLSFFAGEPLLESVARHWQEACPKATIANLYGPTEATVVVIGEVFGPNCSRTRDCIAIGKPFPGVSAGVIDADGKVLPPGAAGELVLAGSQLALGYFRDVEQTAARFLSLRGQTWYRTGDLCTQDTNGTFHYWGRIDNQVKITGYRVELEDVESHLREVADCDAVAAVPWPIRDGTAHGIIAFMVPNGVSESQIKLRMQARVPSYMVPTRVHFLPEIPRNSSGKVNRNVLLEMIELGDVGK